MSDLRIEVQRLIDAGVPEEEIGMFIKKHSGTAPLKAQPQAPPQAPQPQQSGAMKTMQNVGQVYPAVETAANLGTMSYGLPVSGLAGAVGGITGGTPEDVDVEPEFTAGIGYDLDQANRVREAVDNALIYKPQTEAGQELLKATTYPFQKLEELGEYAADPIADAGYPNAAAAVKTGIQGAPMALPFAKRGVTKARTMFKPASKTLDFRIISAIDKGIEKGVKPGIGGKKTHAQMEAYLEKARTSVMEIVRNKDGLALSDGKGGIWDGLPETARHMSQAISQTKRTVFEVFDAINREAGRVGAEVVLEKIAKDLDYIANKPEIFDVNPAVAKYAKAYADRLRDRGKYSTMEAQDVIASINNNLEAFYKNPNYESASMAFIDSLVVNNLRKSLDSVIENTTGKQYQSVKNTYGALKSIEADVTKRAAQDATKAPKNILDFTDVFTGYHAARGILSLDPTTLGAAISANWVKRAWKRVNDPNRRIKEMFSEVEKINQGKKTTCSAGRAYL